MSDPYADVGAVVDKAPDPYAAAGATRDAADPYAAAGAVPVQPATLRPSIDNEMRSVDNRLANNPVFVRYREAVAAQKAAQAQQQQAAQPPEEPNLEDAINAGWQVSVSGLVKRGKNPDVILPEHAPMFLKIMAGMTTLVGDLPAVASGIGLALPTEGTAAAAGAGIGAVAGPGGAAVGATIGAAIPAASAGFAMPAWIRAGLMDYYDKGGKDSSNYMSALASSFLSKRALGEGAKAAVVGAVTGPVGALARPVVGSVAAAAAEIGTMTTVAATLDGHLPKGEDFVVAAATLGVLHAGKAMVRTPELVDSAAAWLRENYRKTGEDPYTASQRLENDPVARQDMYTDVKSKDIAQGYAVDAYHGTTSEIAAFDPTMRGVNTGAGAAKGAFFFSDDAKVASGYATEPGTAGANVVPVRLKLQNPMIVDMEGQFGGGAKMDFMIKHAEANGFDGVVFKNIRDSVEQGKGNEPTTVYAVFKADQVRGRFGGLEQDVAAKEARAAEPPAAATGETPPPKTPKEQILSKIGEPAKRGYTVDDFRYDFVNDLQHASAAVRDALKGSEKPLESYKNPAEQLRLAYGAHGWAENVMQKDLKPIVQPIMKAKKWDDFVSYTISKRVLEKENQGVQTGFDYDAAKAEVARGNGTPGFKEAAEAVGKYQNAWLDRAEKAGVISAEQKTAYKEFNADYIPFNRVMDEAGPGSGAKGFKVRNPAKEMTGSDRDIINPFESAVKNSYTWAQMIRNNEALTRLADFSKALPLDRQFLTKSATKLNVAELSEKDSNLAKFLTEHEIDPKEANGIMIYRAAQRALDDNQILIFEKGKPEIYEAKDPNLIKSLRKLDQATFSSLVKVLKVPAAAFRAGTTLVPEFMLKNIFRDQLGGYIQNTFKSVPVWDFATGFKAMLKDPKAADAWAENGGANSAMLSLDKDIFQKNFFALDKDKALPVDRAWNLVKTPFQFLQAAGMLTENATRLGQNIRAIREGNNPIEAAMRSRDVTLDFYRMGARVRALNAIGSFLGPTINGMDRLAQAFREDPQGAAMRAAAAVTLPTIMLWWANKDEDWYKRQPQWLKDTTWMFRAGGSDEDPTIIRLPKPPLYGTLFGAIPERMLQAYAEHDPHAWEQIGQQIWNDFNPAQGAIPVAISPIVEIATNWNMFTDRPLVSSAQEDTVLPEYRYTQYTTETAKALAKLMPNFVPDRFKTPIAIDHLVKGWTGGIGNYITQVADQGAYTLGLADRPIKPTAKLSDIPFIRAFTVRDPSADTAAIERFYDKTAEASQTLGTYKMLAMQGKTDEAEKVLESGRNVLKLGQMHDAIGNMRRMISAVYDNPNMKPDEKRQLIDNAYRSMNAIAESGVALLDAQK